MHQRNAVCCLGNICKPGKLVLLLFAALKITARKKPHKTGLHIHDGILTLFIPTDY